MRTTTKPSTRFYLVLDNQEISWAPMFDSREEADKWLLERDDHEMLGAKAYEVEVEECAEEGCGRWRYIGEMMPDHHASSNCESGKRDHCTCDWCF